MNPGDVRTYFEFLGHDTYDIRAFTPRDTSLNTDVTVQERVESFEEFKDFCEQHEGEANIYAGVLPKDEDGVSKANVKTVDKVWMELDAERREDGSASEEELEKAREVMEEVLSDYEDFGTPMVVMSGNGYHLIWEMEPSPIASDNREEVDDRIKAFIHKAKEEFETDSVEVDVSVGDLARILKVPGTMSVKGDEENWRESHIEKEPEQTDDEKKAVQDYFFDLDYEDILGINEEPPETQPSEPNDLDDKELIEKAKNASNGRKFEQLWRGSTAGYESQSEADLALCGLLAFWTGGDRRRIDSLFRDSGLYRDKWEREDYRKMTIEKALEGQTDFYDPDEHGIIDNPEEVEEIPRAKRHEPEFEMVLPEDHFMARYQSMEEEVTDAYPEYHFGASLSLLSLATQRMAKAMITPKPVYTNTWVQLIGESTVSRKSTAVGDAKTILQYAGMDHLLHAEEFSREQFFSMMSRDPTYAYWNDDYGDFMGMMSKSYQAGMGQFLCKMYDNPKRVKKELRQEQFEIEDAFFPQFVAIQPETLAKKSDNDEIASGLYPRFLYLYATRHKERMPIESPSEEIYRERKELADWLEELYRFFKTREREVNFKFTDEALKIYNDWAEEVEEYIHRADDTNDLAKFLGRYQMYAFKFSVLFAIGSKEFKENVLENNLETGEVYEFGSQSKQNKQNYQNSQSSQIDDDVEGEDSQHKQNKQNYQNSQSSQSQSEQNSHPISGVGERGYSVYSVNSVEVGKNEQISVILNDSTIRVALHYINKLLLPNALRVMRLIRSYNQDNNVDQVWDKLMDLGGEADHSKLLRATHLMADDFKKSVNTLIQAERLKKEVKEQERPQGGTVEKIKYVALQPEQELNLPGVNVPEFENPAKTELGLDEEDLDFLREDWDIDDDDSGNGEVNQPEPKGDLGLSMRSMNTVLNGGEPVPIDEIAEHFDADINRVEKFLKNKSKEGEVYEPRQGEWELV